MLSCFGRWSTNPIGTRWKIDEIATKWIRDSILWTTWQTFHSSASWQPHCIQAAIANYKNSYESKNSESTVLSHYLHLQIFKASKTQKTLNRHCAPRFQFTCMSFKSSKQNSQKDKKINQIIRICILSDSICISSIPNHRISFN